jgi:endonuclease III
MKLIKKLIRDFGKPYSKQLGINLEKGDKEIFKWFLASILFGKRISENIAMKTYKEFEHAKLLTPENISDAGWDKLVEILDAGGYTRYDYSTATKLLDIMKNLNSLEDLHNHAKNPKDLEKRLQEFNGIGPVTTNIFLRELRVIWKHANPDPSPLVKLAAKNLGINLKNFNPKTPEFVKLEAALLRLGKNLCKKGKCKSCEFRKWCKQNNTEILKVK